MMNTTTAVQKRQAIERQIMNAAVDQLLSVGFSLGVFDGEELTIDHSRIKKEINAALMTTDEDYLFVYEDGAKDHFGWVRFVYGNDGWDVICDYSVNLGPHLTDAMKKIDELSA
jgi:hypothetical protein